MKKNSLKPWWQIAIPHRDIREGRFDESVFAASLGDVIQNKGASDYNDPDIFFRRTFFTTGLTKLITDVLLNLSGISRGSSVIQIQTPFGGGKTHALLALYHVFRHPEKAMQHDAIKAILSNNNITKIPETKVVVFVGEYGDPLKGRTLWGEIAYQLGYYERMKEYDEERVAPHKDLILDMLRANKPVLILMDELLQYVVRASGVEVGEGTLKGQVESFLKALTEAVIASEKCVLISTLPSSVMELFEEQDKGQRILSELQRIFGRVERIYTPVEGEEIYEIIRKRLFEYLGDIEEHRKVIEEYFKLYNRLGEDIPAECREVSYKEKMLKAYPFHPETIDVLYERWATLPTFQRTRGALRLLAEVVADLFKNSEAPLIQPAHINLGKPSIRREFIKHIGNEYEGIIASDISGSNAKAANLDRELREYKDFNVATGIATSIFFYSFSGGEKKGVTIPRLKLAFLWNDIPPTIVNEVVKRLEDELWYLHVEKDLYYFNNIVGLNKVIIDKEEAISEEDIQEKVREIIGRPTSNYFEVFVWPKNNSVSDIPDNKRLKLVILSPYMAYDPSSKESKQNIVNFMQNIVNNYSTTFRIYKNTLVFVIADSNEFERFKGSIRRYLALKAIKNDKVTMDRLTEEDKNRVNEGLKEQESILQLMLLSVYRHIGKASTDSTDGIVISDAGIPTIEKGLTISKRVEGYLMDKEILLGKISPKFLVDRILSKEEDSKKFSEIWEAFLKYPGLPMLKDRDVLVDAVVQGVKDGTFGLLIGDNVKYAESVSPIEVTEEALIVREEVAKRMKEGTATLVRKEIKENEVYTPVVREDKAEKEEQPPEVKAIIKKFTLRFGVDVGRLSDVLRGIIMPLQHDGARISLEIKIDAESPQGIKSDTLNLKIRETLKQIGAKVLEEKEY